MSVRLDHGDDDLAELHEINVTPFIDVMLVLLIIFMVAAPLATVDIHVNLPVAKAEPTPRPDKPIYLTVKSDLTYAIGETPVSKDQLGGALQAATKGDKDMRIFLRADKSVPYGEMMEVLNAMRSAGYVKVALMGLEKGAGAVIGIIDDYRTEWRRWLLSGVVVVMAHGALAAGLIYWHDEDDSGDEGSALAVDLASFLTEPVVNSTELPPGPEQVQAEATPERKEEKVEEKPEEKVEVTETHEPEPEIPPMPEMPSEFVLAALPPKAEPEPEPPKVEQPPAPATTAPAVRAVAAGERIWLRQISTVLERNKRYPASANGAEGTVQVNFSLDRQGRVTRSRIVRGSGFSILDKEALDWLQRAQPFPAPPANVADEKLSMTVPYRFNSR